MPTAIDQLKSASKRDGQTACVMAADGKAAASFRAVKRECTDDGVSAQAQAVSKPRNISGLILRVGEKVKGRPVVPNIVGPRRLPGGRIGCNPSHPVCFFAHARSRGSKRCGRQIEDCHILVTLRYKAIGKPRGPATDINDGGGLDCPDEFDQLQGGSGRFLKPADLALAFGGVDILPVALTAHVVHWPLSLQNEVSTRKGETGGR